MRTKSHVNQKGKSSLDFDFKCTLPDLFSENMSMIGDNYRVFFFGVWGEGYGTPGSFNSFSIDLLVSLIDLLYSL